MHKFTGSRSKMVSNRKQNVFKARKTNTISSKKAKENKLVLEKVNFTKICSRFYLYIGHKQVH